MATVLIFIFKFFLTLFLIGAVVHTFPALLSFILKLIVMTTMLTLVVACLVGIYFILLAVVQYPQYAVILGIISLLMLIEYYSHRF